MQDEFDMSNWRFITVRQLHIQCTCSTIDLDPFRAASTPHVLELQSKSDSEVSSRNLHLLFSLKKLQCTPSLLDIHQFALNRSEIANCSSCGARWMNRNSLPEIQSEGDTAGFREKHYGDPLWKMLFKSPEISSSGLLLAFLSSNSLKNFALHCVEVCSNVGSQLSDSGKRQLWFFSVFLLRRASALSEMSGGITAL